MTKKLFILGILLGVLLGKVWGSNAPLLPKGYSLSGKLTLNNTAEDALYILKDLRKDNNYILKVRRNSVDSKFMAQDAIVSGWIEIPIPIPFIGPIIKKHYIKYRDSDVDWDYFTVVLE